MDFFTIGSLGDYTRNLRLQMRWDQKKAGGDVTAHTDAQGDLKPRRTETAPMYQQQTGEQREGGGETLQAVMDKVARGKKLTGEEEEILKAGDPALYHRYRSIEQERKSYERELKRCKTRDEVQRVKLAHMNSTLTTVKSVANNPNIPDGKKKAILEMEKVRTDKLNAATDAFVRRGGYAQLPTDREKAKAEKELREQEESGRRPETETAAKPGGAAPAEASETDIRTDSPEQRKLRRAKAKAAFPAFQEEPEFEPAVDFEA